MKRTLINSDAKKNKHNHARAKRFFASEYGGTWVKNVILSLFTIVFLLFSCEPFEKVSNIPEIHFKSMSDIYIALDTSSNISFHATDLIFSFIDGDSDIGVSRTNNDTAKNLILVPYDKVDGEYLPLDAEIYGRKYQIYSNEKLNTGRTVNGEIKVQIQYFIYPPPFDTIKYDFYIIDKANHLSNIESTSDITFP